MKQTQKVGFCACFIIGVEFTVLPLLHYRSRVYSFALAALPGTLIFPGPLRARLKQAHSWKNLQELHKYCQGLEWNTNLLAIIAATLEPAKSKELYEQIEDDEDFYTASDGCAYYDDDEFTDDETADEYVDSSTGSFDEGCEGSSTCIQIPQEADNNSSVPSVTQEPVAIFPPIIPTTSESAEVETVLTPPVKRRSDSILPLCTYADSCVRRLAFMLWRGHQKKGCEGSSTCIQIPQEADNNSSVPSVTQEPVAIFPPIIPTTSESAEVETVLTPPVKRRSDSILPLCTYADSCVRRLAFMLRRGHHPCFVVTYHVVCTEKRTQHKNQRFTKK